MNKRLLFTISALMSLLLVSFASCQGKSNTAAGDEYYEVKRGELDVIVSSEGYLSMPNQFDLRFGTTGTVGQILVEEGDIVHQGAILAFMDNTQQINAIRTALYNLYAAVYATGSPSLQSQLCATPTICSSNDIPKGYPELSAPRIFMEAQNDLSACMEYFQGGLYRDAGFKLALAYADTEVCEKIIESKVDPSVYAGAKPNSIINPEASAGVAEEMSQQDMLTLGYLKNFREKILDISGLFADGAYADAVIALYEASQQMIELQKEVENTVHHNSDLWVTYADTPTSLNFLQSSMRLLDELDTYSRKDDATVEEMAKQLIMTRLNLDIGSSVLEEGTLAYGWGRGYTWQQLQNYNLNVQNAEIALYKAKQEFTNTVIVAPSNGVVASVDLKENYILSAQDYSTRTAIKLVDTSAVKFTGTVDEIDILKVSKGQKTVISIDAMPNQQFSGTVKFISPFGTAVGRVIKFNVIIELDPTDVPVRGGLSATADIESYRAENVILVPASAIITTPRFSTVMVLNQATGETESRRVTKGRQNMQYVEILSGLDEGEKILLNASASTLPGFGMVMPMPMR